MEIPDHSKLKLSGHTTELWSFNNVDSGVEK